MQRGGDAGQDKTAVSSKGEVREGRVGLGGVVVGIIGGGREVAGAYGYSHEAETYALVGVEQARHEVRAGGRSEAGNVEARRRFERGAYSCDCLERDCVIYDDWPS